MDFLLKPVEADDASFLFELFCDVRAGEFAPLGLPAAALEQLMQMQFRGQTGGYAAQFPEAKDWIVWAEGERAGRMLLQEDAAEVRIVDLALLQRYRGQGVGSRLLDGVCGGGKEVRLSVRFGNPAIGLYERKGFARTGGDGVYVAMEYRGRAERESKEEVQRPTGEVGEQEFSSRYFRSVVGTAFRVGDMELKLVGVQVMPVAASMEMGDSFVLQFRGPMTPVLEAGTREMRPAGGEAMEIFVSPVQADASGVEYEAVFNRTVRV